MSEVLNKFGFSLMTLRFNEVSSEVFFFVAEGLSYLQSHYALRLYSTKISVELTFWLQTFLMTYFVEILIQETWFLMRTNKEHEENLHFNKVRMTFVLI
jgi:hypothetical protein